MTKNPIINALTAGAYIILVASIMFYGPKHTGPDDSIIAPIAIISLFTLSAAIMAYLFLYQPILLLLDSKKKEAVKFFSQSIVTFAVLTILALVLLFFGTS